VVGFGAMVPFMNTSLYVGPVAAHLDGADLSFYVGFLVAAAVYAPLRRWTQRRRSGTGAAVDDGDGAAHRSTAQSSSIS